LGDFREKLSITRVEKSDTDLITVMLGNPVYEQNSNTQKTTERF